MEALGELHKNLSLRDAIKIAKHLGVKVYPARRKGETLFDHPFMGKRYRIHTDRKDAGKGLVCWLRTLCRRIEEEESRALNPIRG